jgi:predicted lipid carrier protein YhbT
LTIDFVQVVEYDADRLGLGIQTDEMAHAVGKFGRRHEFALGFNGSDVSASSASPRLPCLSISSSSKSSKVEETEGRGSGTRIAEGKGLHPIQDKAANQTEGNFGVQSRFLQQHVLSAMKPFLRFPALPRIPEFHLPGFIRAVTRRLPQWPHALSLALALNVARRLEILPEDALTLIEGKTIRVVIEDGGSQACLTARNGRFQPVWASAETGEDVCFRGELHAFLKLLTRQEDPDTLFFNRQLSIEGDTELGLAIKNLLDGIDWPPPILQRFTNMLTCLRPEAQP